MTLHCASTISLGSEEVGIAVSRGLLGCHLGLVYTANGEQKLLHLAFHKMLLNDTYPPPPGTWAVKVMELPSIASSQLVALLMAIAPNESGLPYGINLIAGMGAIELDGEYVPGPGSDGYTCSSFIAELLRKVGFPLVDFDSWKPSDANVLWGDAVLCLLKAFGASDDHLALVAQNNSGYRLRPEEVAAASELPYTERPATQLAIAARAPALMEEVLAICHPAPPPPPNFRICVAAYAKGMGELASSSGMKD
jgi:hypothetical protein